MSYERTRWGILIDEKYLSAPDALELLQWLLEHQEWLQFRSQPKQSDAQETPTTHECRRGNEWSAEEEEQIHSEDEQIVYL